MPHFKSTMLYPMSEITRILETLSEPKEQAPNPSSLEKLLPLVYDELRVLAKSKLAAEKKGHTLQPTDLVHEAFMRLVGNSHSVAYQNRKYFFAAAAEAMRRILVEAARKKMAIKRGANAPQEWFDLLQLHDEQKCQELVFVHDALDELAQIDSKSSEVVKLRYFSGFTMDEIAEILGISKRQTQTIWAFARSWLFRALKSDSTNTSGSSASAPSI
jgi:RNA polymerase sigma factor (TIGR02999 family)